MKKLCPVCGREVQVRPVPRGDGTLVRPVRHKDASGQPCEGKYHELDV